MNATMRVHTPPHRDADGHVRATYHFLQHPGTIAETLLCAIILTDGHVTSLSCAPRQDAQGFVEQAQKHFNQHK